MSFRTRSVRSFAQEMIRDHQAVNAKALALVKKLLARALLDPPAIASRLQMYIPPMSQRRCLK